MEGRTLVHMRIEAVRVDGRYRKDLGDITSLAKSIADVGLINPITVTTDGRLIAGERRLEAVRLLGLDTIPAFTVAGLDEAVAKLRAERDENTERKEMALSEQVALTRALEEIEKPKAKERQGARTDLATSVSTDTDVVVSTNGRVADLAAKAAGFSSPSSYHRAKTVVEAAADPEQPAEVRAVAQAALAEMDATGRVNRAYEKVRAATNPSPEPKAKPKPSARKRRPLPEVAKDAGWALRKEVEKAERIFSDDRFTGNKQQVAMHLHSHLTYAVEALTRLLGRITQEGE